MKKAVNIDNLNQKNDDKRPETVSTIQSYTLNGTVKTGDHTSFLQTALLLFASTALLTGLRKRNKNKR